VVIWWRWSAQRTLRRVGLACQVGGDFDGAIELGVGPGRVFQPVGHDDVRRDADDEPGGAYADERCAVLLFELLESA